MNGMSHPRTIIEKLWDSHVVTEKPGAPALIYIDLHLVHEVTSPQAFRRSARARPEGSPPGSDHGDHRPSARPPRRLAADSSTRSPPRRSRNSKRIARSSAFRCYGLTANIRASCHVIGPEQGLTQPGMTVVCGDSHTATHGAFGALAFGIGTSEVEHVLATQCLLQRKSKTFEFGWTGSSSRASARKTSSWI